MILQHNSDCKFRQSMRWKIFTKLPEKFTEKGLTEKWKKYKIKEENIEKEITRDKNKTQIETVEQ